MFPFHLVKQLWLYLSPAHQGGIHYLHTVCLYTFLLYELYVCFGQDLQISQKLIFGTLDFPNAHSPLPKYFISLVLCGMDFASNIYHNSKHKFNLSA